MSVATVPGDWTNRGAKTGLALQLVCWVGSRRRPFSAAEFRLGTGLERRTAYRWLLELEAEGVIEVMNPHVARSQGRWYVPRVRIERTA